MRDRILTFLGIIGIIFGTHAQAGSVCGTGEKEFFSCQMQSKVAALCGSKDQNSDRLYMRYVVKKAGKLEMQYPILRSEAAQNFRESRTMLPHGGYIAVSFDFGKYKYILRQAWDTQSPAWAAISVLKSGKQLTEYSCDNELGPDPTFFEFLPKDTLPSEEYWWPNGG